MKPTKAKLAVWIPTYKRPETLAGVVDNLRAATDTPFEIYFGIERDDQASWDAANKLGCLPIWNTGKPGYSDTIQTIYENSNEPFFIHANDDFLFLPHWDEGPLSMFDNPDIMVVGVRQTEGDTHGSAISMVRRKYIEEQSGVIDMPNRVFYPYNHNYVDTEFTATAQKRGVWAMYPELVIVHQHPGFTGKPKDSTHLKNDETSPIDNKTYESRRHLWE